jgi:ParB family transcriptional regulator, chromosome partitioning protein
MDTASAVASPDVKLLPVEQIQSSPYQARKNFDPENLQGLADSMKEEGLLQPIVVQPSNGSFQLISGERRYRAAKLLNWPTIEAKVVQTVSEADAAAKSLVENLQRLDLNPIEEAEGFDRLAKLDPNYWTQPRIAKITRKTQGYISQSLKIRGLPGSVIESIRRLILSRSHALELQALDDPQKQEAAAKEVVDKDLSIKETRKLVASLLNKAPEPAAAKAGKPLEDLVWKGDKIIINRPFDPASETAESYIAWLTQALPAFAETRPLRAAPREEAESAVSGAAESAVSGKSDPAVSSPAAP